MATMQSPQKDTLPYLSLAADLQPPPSPRTHRALRRLQSAHSLGGNRNQPSLISQQRLREQQAQQQQEAQQQQQTQQQQIQQQHVQDQPPVSPTKSRAPDIAASTTTTSTTAASTTSTTSTTTTAATAATTDSPSRGRANSDAEPPLTYQMNVFNASKRSGARKPVFSHGHLSLAQIIRDGPTDGDYLGALESARWKVIDEGVKSAEDGMSTVRIYVWLILLDTPIMPTDDYLALIHRGASPAYSKIRNDTFRTLTTDPLFRRRVSEASLIRLLNAIAWKLYDARDDQTSEQQQQQQQQQLSVPASRSSMARTSLASNTSEQSSNGTSGTYVQGMNVLAAPFLYAARSEAEAFVAFHSLLTRECPGYIRGAMDGVHRGLALVDRVLAIVDPKLAAYLTSKGMSAEIYAFPSVLTLCACTPPLPEVLRLWDFLFAYGPHLNIVCIVAQLTIMRAQILQSPSPNKVLRSFPQLNADLVKNVTISIIKKIPDNVYGEIVTHAL